MRTTVISAGYSRMSAGSRVMEHSHVCYQIYYVIHGNPVFIIGGQEFPARPNSVLYIPPNTPHKMLALQGEDLLTIDLKVNIDDPFLASHLARISGPLPDDGYMKKIFIYIQENWRCKDPQNVENIDTLLTSALMGFFLDDLSYDNADSCRIITKDYSVITRTVMAYIESDFQKKFSLQALSEKLGYSQSYLSTSFTKSTGITIVDYLNLIRIRHAMVMLAFFGQDIFTTYESVGFSNASHFSRTFKELVGTSPRNVRSAFSHGSRSQLYQFFDSEPILNFQMCTLEATFASLRSIGAAVNGILQEKEEQKPDRRPT